MKGPVLAAQHQLGLGQRFTAVDDFVDQGGIQGVGTDHLAAAGHKGPVFAEVVQPVGVGGEVFPQGVVGPSAGRRKPDAPGAELFQQIKKVRRQAFVAGEQAAVHIRGNEFNGHPEIPPILPWFVPLPPGKWPAALTNPGFR